MKKLNTLIIAFMFIAGYAFAQCPASFTWTQTNPNEISFTNTSSPQNPNATYYWWDFGNAQYSNLNSPTLTYNSPGVYYVCLTIMDSLQQITCTFCDSVNVTGSVLCNMWCSVQQTTQATCSTCADGVATVGVVNGTPPYVFQWSNGGTTQSISNLLPGPYSVCVTDANGCTSCDSGYVSYPVTTCSITFNPTVQTNGWVDFNDYATWSNNIYPDVTWNFGDATTGTGLNMWHLYTASGSYYVCVTLYDSIINCTASLCDTVVVNLPPAPACDANFFVQLDSVNTNQAWIYNFSTGSPTMTYQWWWGDNTPADTGAYPTHVYQATGSYNICLVVVDQVNQCTDTMCQLLWVPRLSQAAASAPFYVNVVPPVVTGITHQTANETWTLYPNPSSDVIHVNGYNSQNGKYIITDISGRVVQSGNTTDNAVDVSSLTSGVYFFTLEKENGVTESKRFIRN